MKTTHNVASVSAQLMRAATQELTLVTQSRRDVDDSLARRTNALDSLDEIANQLEQYAGKDDTNESAARSAETV